jgi:hypothetical protein
MHFRPGPGIDAKLPYKKPGAESNDAPATLFEVKIGEEGVTTILVVVYALSPEPPNNKESDITTIVIDFITGRKTDFQIVRNGFKLSPINCPPTPQIRRCFLRLDPP